MPDRLYFVEVKVTRYQTIADESGKIDRDLGFDVWNSVLGFYRDKGDAVRHAETVVARADVQTFEDWRTRAAAKG